ncbi:hypothetical protein [Aeromicrobium sp.]|uniref:hypothetical protein n=1 Tax=Aeromicrobium sp. TaxID=1871063 RepID=UPI004034F088
MEVFLQAVSSAAAIIATGLSLFLLRQGQSDRRALRREQRRDQATRISSWADWYSDDQMTFAQPRMPGIYVANASGAAIYDVFVDFRDPISGDHLRAPVGPVPPNDQKRVDVEVEGPFPSGWAPEQLFAQVNFLDAGGVRWTRGFQGRLLEDPGPGEDDFFERGGTLLDR